MKGWPNRWKQTRHWDTSHYRDYGYTTREPFGGRRFFVKQTLVAVALFGVFITFHDGEHWIARVLDNGVHYMLNQHVDPAALMRRAGLAKYSPDNIDLSVFKYLPVIAKRQPQELMVVPIEGKVVGNFGWRVNTNTNEQIFAEGLDWDTAVGTPVKAAASGQVKEVADSAQYGKTIIIQHNDNIETVYGYCTDILVQKGDPVTQGQIIAKAAQKKEGDLARFYLEVRVQGQAVDPKTRMNIVGP